MKYATIFFCGLGCGLLSTAFASSPCPVSLRSFSSVTSADVDGIERDDLAAWISETPLPNRRIGAIEHEFNSGQLAVRTFDPEAWLMPGPETSRTRSTVILREEQ